MDYFCHAMLPFSFNKMSDDLLGPCHAAILIKKRWASSLVVGICYQEMHLARSASFFVAESGAGAVTGSGIAASWLNR